jgi:hypothetical protein
MVAVVVEKKVRLEQQEHRVLVLAPVFIPLVQTVVDALDVVLDMRYHTTKLVEIIVTVVVRVDVDQKRVLLIVR